MGEEERQRADDELVNKLKLKKKANHHILGFLEKKGDLGSPYAHSKGIDLPLFSCLLSTVV